MNAMSCSWMTGIDTDQIYAKKRKEKENSFGSNYQDIYNREM